MWTKKDDKITYYNICVKWHTNSKVRINVLLKNNIVLRYRILTIYILPHKQKNHFEVKYIPVLEYQKRIIFVLILLLCLLFSVFSVNSKHYILFSFFFFFGHLTDISVGMLVSHGICCLKSSWKHSTHTALEVGTWFLKYSITIMMASSDANHFTCYMSTCKEKCGHQHHIFKVPTWWYPV